jgi:hypothetical protein
MERSMMTQETLNRIRPQTNHTKVYHAGVFSSPGPPHRINETNAPYAGEKLVPSPSSLGAGTDGGESTRGFDLKFFGLWNAHKL